VWKTNVLMIVLLLLTLSYVPITSSILTMMNCEQLTCESGKSFYVELPTVCKGGHGSYVNITLIHLLAVKEIGYNFIKKTGSESCMSCSLQSNCSIPEILCPATVDSRLVEDSRFSCSKEIYIFYTPGAILMLLSFTFGVPCNEKYFYG
jgi:hypothetical protein